MNNDLAREVYQTSHHDEMSFTDYLDKIRTGFEIMEKQPGTDAAFIKSFTSSDAEAIKLALEYNESLILSMLV